MLVSYIFLFSLITEGLYYFLLIGDGTGYDFTIARILQYSFITIFTAGLILHNKIIDFFNFCLNTIKRFNYLKVYLLWILFFSITTLVFLLFEKY